MKMEQIFYFLIIMFLIYSWKLFLIDFLGETGVYGFLGILNLIIFSSFPFYLLEYFLTGWEFKKSVSGAIFFYSSCCYVSIIISAFLCNNLFHSKSFLDKILRKKNLI